VECRDEEQTSRLMNCTNGDVLELVCNGTAGMITRRCPERRYDFACESLVQLTGSQGCTMLRRSDTNITCKCSLLFSPLDPADNSAISFDFIAVGQTVAIDFLQTWSSAGELNAKVVVENLSVLFVVSSIFILGSLALVIGYQYDCHDERILIAKNMTIAGRVRAKRGGARGEEGGGGNQVDGSNNSSFLSKMGSSLFPPPPVTKSSSSTAASSSKSGLRDLRRRLVVGMEEAQSLEEALPFVMRQTPIVQKATNEIRMYHRWFGIAFHYSPVYSRPLRVLSIIVRIVVMLFIQAVIYNIAHPDDGSCLSHNTSDSCLRDTSPLSSSDSRCLWDTATSECSTRPFASNFRVVFLVAMASGLLSAPLSISLQSIILFILAAKTLTAEDIEQKKSSTRTSTVNNRKMAKVSTVESFGSSHTALPILPTELLDDFGNLIAHLKLHRQRIPNDLKTQFDGKVVTIMFLCVYVSVYVRV
jgi:hypothetical protein